LRPPARGGSAVGGRRGGAGGAGGRRGSDPRHLSTRGRAAGGSGGALGRGGPRLAPGSKVLPRPRRGEPALESRGRGAGSASQRAPTSGRGGFLPGAVLLRAGGTRGRPVSHLAGRPGWQQ